ncbi:MAG: AmmeMemoRadiSam system protein B [Planctomycetota bacterium]
MNATDRPRLRAVEPVQVEVEGRTLIALKDPDSYSEETALVDPGLLGLLVVFDGISTIDEICARLESEGVKGVTPDGLTTLAESLDRCFLLDNERFRDERAAREAAFASEPVRAAAHAGSAYPAGADEARTFLDEMLGDGAGDKTQTSTGHVRRLIAPHIDLRLGADVHGGAHRALAGAPRPERVVVLGVCHAASDRRVIACRKDFATPLGTLRHDAAFLDALEARSGDCFDADQMTHKAEHSVEFQALWIARHWPDNPPLLVPLLIGSFHDLIEDARSPADDPEIDKFVNALRDTIAEARGTTLLIASVDLAHRGPRYGDADGLDEDAETEQESADRVLLDHIVAGDAESFFQDIAHDKNARNVCGVAPIYLTLRLDETPGELLSYGQGRIDPDTGSLVTYTAVAFP